MRDVDQDSFHGQQRTVGCLRELLIAGRAIFVPRALLEQGVDQRTSLPSSFALSLEHLCQCDPRATFKIRGAFAGQGSAWAIDWFESDA